MLFGKCLSDLPILERRGPLSIRRSKTIQWITFTIPIIFRHLPHASLLEQKNHLFLAIDSVGIFLSTDHGDSWSKCKSDGLSVGIQNFSGFGATANGTLFMLTERQGYTSTDEGNSWVAEDGFYNPYRFIATTPSGIYAWGPAGWGDNGVLARYQGYTAAVSSVTSRPAKSSTGTVFPNPFSSTTEIQFTLASPETATIIVVDPLGREVFRSTRNYSIGLQTIPFDGSMLTSGAYYYRIASAEGTLAGVMMLDR